MSIPVTPGCPQDCTGEEEGDGSASRELGVGGVSPPICEGGWAVPPFVTLPWNPVTKAARWTRDDALPTGFPFLDTSWVLGNCKNILFLTLVNRWVAVMLPNV